VGLKEGREVGDPDCLPILLGFLRRGKIYDISGDLGKSGTGEVKEEGQAEKRVGRESLIGVLSAQRY